MNSKASVILQRRNLWEFRCMSGDGGRKAWGHRLYYTSYIHITPRALPSQGRDWPRLHRLASRQVGCGTGKKCGQKRWNHPTWLFGPLFPGCGRLARYVLWRHIWLWGVVAPPTHTRLLEQEHLCDVKPPQSGFSWKWKCLSLSHVWLRNSTDCSPAGSSVHGILKARILGWVAISSSRGSSWPRNWTHVSCVSCIAGYSLLLSHQENPKGKYTFEIKYVKENI